jgi:hypothetical protein
MHHWQYAMMSVCRDVIMTRWRDAVMTSDDDGVMTLWQ